MTAEDLDGLELEIAIRNHDPAGLFGGRYAEIPEEIKQRLLAYLQTGEYPGQFLEGVITNDLRKTVNSARGTEYEQWYVHVPLLVWWVHNRCPGNAIGYSNYMERVDNRPN